MSQPQAVGIVGATGAVGAELIRVLSDLRYPVSGLHLFASERSAGKRLSTPYGEIAIEPYELAKAEKLDLVFLAVSGDFAKANAPELARKTRVIDNSSAFRYAHDVPLVVPEINAERAREARLIANPNCTTAILAVALWPLHRAFRVRKTIVSTYQATSGAGAEGMAELLAETRSQIEGRAAGHKVFAHPIAFNVIPHIDSFQDNGYTREEMKVVWETRKIFAEPDFALSCTAVRVPTLRVHAEAVTIETELPIAPEAAREVLAGAPGIKVVDDPARALYPMPLSASGRFEVEVGRIRRNLIFGERGLDFFICGDQLDKGAALNAVQIAQLFLN